MHRTIYRFKNGYAWCKSNQDNRQYNYVRTPNIREAEKIVLRQEEFNKPKQRLNAAIKKCNDNMVSGQIDLPSTLDVIKVILELMKDTDMAFQYENLLILLIASAINHQELENEKREKFCTIWINGIEKLFSNGSFLADIALMPVLLNQLENDVASGIKIK